MTRKSTASSEEDLAAAEAAAGEVGVRLREARAELARCSRALGVARDQLAASGVDGEAIRRARLRPLRRAFEDAELRADQAAGDLFEHMAAVAAVRRRVEGERSRRAEPEYRRHYQAAIDAFAAALGAYREADEFARGLEDSCPLPCPKLGNSDLVWVVETLLEEAADAGYSVPGGARVAV